MPTWPATLPQSPEREGYAEDVPYPVIQAPVDGPPKARRRYTAAPKTYQASFLLTKTELDTFEAWFEADVRGGSLAYDWKERGIASNPVRSFRIVDRPQIVYVGGPLWRLTLSIIRLP
ncbi:MAG: hypothetical protein ACPHN2_04850 [Sinimarinibacterium flocculans]|uniref:hypothetical protein n=1 Tax=Sinimarinibacterium flocculans TaxID=985250 RepID=UPI003C33A923